MPPGGMAVENLWLWGQREPGAPNEGMPRPRVSRFLGVLPETVPLGGAQLFASCWRFWSVGLRSPGGCGEAGEPGRRLNINRTHEKVRKIVQRHSSKKYTKVESDPFGLGATVDGCEILFVETMVEAITFVGIDVGESSETRVSR